MSNFYIISGDDDFSRKKRARELAAQLGGNDPDDPGIEIIAGDDESRRPGEIIGDFADALNTPPFLSPHKLIWLRHFTDFDLLFGKGGAFAAVLAQLSSPLPEEIDIIIDAPGLDQRKSGVKALKGAGAIIELYNNLKSSDRNFAENRRRTLDSIFASAGKTIEPRALSYLLETVGGASGNLANEAEKLLLYTGSRNQITLADCEAVTSRTPEAVGWEFTSAVAEGDRVRALKLLDTLFVKDSDAILLIASLSNEFQRYSQLKVAMKELGVTRVNPNSFKNLPQEVVERHPDNPLLKIHPFRAFKMCEAAAAMSPAELAAKLGTIRDASCAVVSGGGDQRQIVERLILRLTRK